MEARIDLIRKQISPILEANGVKSASIFGSFARGDIKRKSDVDILVEFNGRTGLFEFIALKLALEKKLGRKVDLVELHAVDPYLKGSIMRQRVQIL
ncbi:MAG: nucleotidyltransferase family protein [Candidatus Micrarchaeaceae archaeon]